MLRDSPQSSHGDVATPEVVRGMMRTISKYGSVRESTGKYVNEQYKILTIRKWYEQGADSAKVIIEY